MVATNANLDPKLSHGNRKEAYVFFFFVSPKFSTSITHPSEGRSGGHFTVEYCLSNTTPFASNLVGSYILVTGIYPCQ
jgi:hypothetical protein